MNKSSLASAVAAAAILFGGLAHGAGLPATHRSGDVEYLSGGIGSDESSAIQAARPQWSLSLEFAVQGGARADYAADVRVVVSSSTGQVVLDTVSDGPYLLARLPPGSYSVDATFKDKRLHQLVNVGAKGGAKAVFVWPSVGG